MKDFFLSSRFPPSKPSVFPENGGGFTTAFEVGAVVGKTRGLFQVSFISQWKNRGGCVFLTFGYEKWVKKTVEEERSCYYFLKIAKTP